MVVNEEMVSDHKSNADDVKTISKSKLEKMDMYERLEYRFPFYKMDVNGYIVHIKEAMKLFMPDKLLFNIKSVDLESLQTAFKNYKSWDDLNDPDSDFVKFLKETCSSENPYEEKTLFSVQKLRNLGILWCNGSAKEKAFEFYDVI